MEFRMSNKSSRRLFNVKGNTPFFKLTQIKKEGYSFRVSLLKKSAATCSPTFYCSTIGAIGLNFPVRNGKGWNPDAITT